MSESIILSLYRCSATEEQREYIPNERNISYYVTDYFDGIQVERFQMKDCGDLKDPEGRMLADCMGIQRKANYDKKGISHHRYWLYSEEGDESIDVFSAELKEEYPLLTVIQVFMNSNIYQAKGFVDPSSEGDKKTSNNFDGLKYENNISTEDVCYQKLKNELNAIVNSECKWKVFRVLTAGNFIVAVRSKTVQDAYNVAFAIRGIRLVFCGKNNINNKVSEEAVFHTYSIIGIADDNILNRTIGGKCTWTKYLVNDTQIVLRIRFTQKFRDASDGEINNICVKGFHLAGRYDYEMILNPEEFNIVYPYIRQYKFVDRNLGAVDVNAISAGKEKCELLLNLLTNQYVSYINERILLVNSETTIPKIMWYVYIDQNREYKTLLKNNAERIDSANEKIKKLEERMKFLYKYARNLQEYIRVLIRFTRILNEMNQRKELRVSVSSLLRQLNALLDSMENYVVRAVITLNQLRETIENQERNDWKNIYLIEREDELRGGLKMLAQEMENNIGDAIYSLEMFLRYLRNINAQTLQTPNFDLQTNVCIEKLLVAYSNFISKCVRKSPNNGTSNIKSNKNLYPIMVPNLNKRDFSVEVLFDYEVTDDYSDLSDDQIKTYGLSENELNKETIKNKKKLMVVYSPTFEFLCETCVVIPSIFHEIGHQFRYEDRAPRNEVLRKYILKKIIYLLLLEVINDKKNYDIEYVVRVALPEIYSECEKALPEVSQLSIARLQNSLNEGIEDFFNAVIDKKNFVHLKAKEYCEKTRFAIFEYNQDMLDALNNVSVAIDNAEQYIRDIGEDRGSNSRNIFMQVSDKVENLHAVQMKQLSDYLIKYLSDYVPEEDLERIRKIFAKRDLDFEEMDNSVSELKEIFKRAKLESLKNQDQLIEIIKMYMNVKTIYIEFSEHQNCVEGDYRCVHVFNKIVIRAKEAVTIALSDYMNNEKNEDSILEKVYSGQSNMQLEKLKETFNYQSVEEFEDVIIEKIKKIKVKTLSDQVYTSFEIYREITSDLFMCAVMKLDIWGYLTLVSQMFKFSKFNQEQQYFRIQMVIQCMMVKGNNKKDKRNFDYDQYQKMLKKIVVKKLKHLCKELKSYSDKIFSEFGKESITEKYSTWFDSIEYAQEELKKAECNWETCNKIMRILRKYPEDIDGKTECIRGSLSDGKDLPLFSSTQGWIIRVTIQSLAIIMEIKGYDVLKNNPVEEIIWSDLVRTKSYYNNKKDIKDFRQRIDEANDLCNSISVIMNNPIKFFNSKKLLLEKEIGFILKEYEESCQQAFADE